MIFVGYMALGLPMGWTCLIYSMSIALGMILQHFYQF